MTVEPTRRALLCADAPGARAFAAAELTRADLGTARRADLLADCAFACIIDADFAGARAGAEEVLRGADGVHPVAQALVVLATAMAGPGSAPDPGASIQVLADAVSAQHDDARDPWLVCLIGEAAMASGRVDLAETVARLIWREGSRGTPYAVFAGQTLTRALLFQGLLTEAAAVGTQAAEAARHHDLDLLQVVLAATLGYLAALRGDGLHLRQTTELITALASSQAPSYYRTGAMVLASFALAADGQAKAASQMLLDGGGGPELPGLQRVDQAYGYELLTTAALAQGQLTQARDWVARATALRGLPTGGMAAAAVQRTSARLAAAEGDPITSAVLAAQAAAFAQDNAGYLDAARARLLAGTAMLQSTHGGEPARQQLTAAAEQARLLGATSLHLLARRDLRSIGLRLAGGGEAPMSRRERQIADLVMAGLSNAQIARVLSISPRTVQGHVRRVLIALDLPSRSAVPRAMLPAVVPPDAAALTARQRDVADLIRRGYTNEGIALALGVSVKTVEKHLGAIYQRLGIRSRTALAAQWAG